MSSERRINKQLLQYWNQIKESGESIPLESSVNPDDIKDIWDNCFIIEVDNLTYRHLGRNLSAISEGKSIVAQDIYNTLMCPENSNINSVIEEVVKNKAPIINESQFFNKYDVIVKYRRCVLPLLDKNGNISIVIGGLRWKS